MGNAQAEKHPDRSKEAQDHRKYVMERTEAAMEVVTAKGDPLLLLALRSHDKSLGIEPPKDSNIAHVNSAEAQILIQGEDVGVIRQIVFSRVQSDIPKGDGSGRPMSYHDFLSPRLHKGTYFFVADKKRIEEVLEFLSTMIVAEVHDERKKALRHIFKNARLKKEEIDQIFEFKAKADRKERGRLAKLARGADTLAELSG
ncbi:MAG TPA: hypothetical protein VL944_01855 [Candidatus Acidoferrum sp.]|nr:hypothetical protein [Candidatus Acidoferrum sp.]